MVYRSINGFGHCPNDFAKGRGQKDRCTNFAGTCCLGIIFCQAHTIHWVVSFIIPGFSVNPFGLGLAVEGDLLFPLHFMQKPQKGFWECCIIFVRQGFGSARRVLINFPKSIFFSITRILLDIKCIHKNSGTFFLTIILRIRTG